ncbi:MAG TPA: RNA methyltransferase [Rhodanobacteraceae bacterium]
MYRNLSDGELVRAHGVFIAEGRLVVQRVIEHGGYAVRSVLVNDAALRSLERTLVELDASVPVYVSAADAFPAITGYNIHRGCLAVVERPRERSIDEVSAGARTLVVLEAVTNADNVGGVFRNAASFGCSGVVLSPTCCDPLYRKAVRTSMGAVLSTPFARANEWPQALAQLRADGFTIAALTPRDPSTSIDDFVRVGRPERLAIVAGTEGSGLTVEADALADVRLRIPIADAVDSLNVAVAVGIALYALR